MLTRKHFEMLAQVLRELRPTADPRTWHHAYNAITAMCMDSNPLFDTARFKKACEREV
jgi:hypothetical protein